MTSNSFMTGIAEKIDSIIGENDGLVICPKNDTKVQRINDIYRITKHEKTLVMKKTKTGIHLKEGYLDDLAEFYEIVKIMEDSNE